MACDRVIKEEKGKPLEGELIARAKDRDEIWDKAPIGKDLIYVTYAGPPLKRVMLQLSEDKTK